MANNANNAIYTVSKVKHHPDIISEMVFIYRFLQKINQFVIYSTRVFPWYVEPVRMPFDTLLKLSCIHQPLFWGIPFKVP